MTSKIHALACAVFAAAMTAGTVHSASAQELNIYSSRHYQTDERLYSDFEEKTGITINRIEGNGDVLIERIASEGVNTPADLLITVDAGRLYRAQQAELFRPVESQTLRQRVPEHLRHDDGEWFGLSQRARVIAYSTDRVDPEQLSTYLALGDDRWEDRICVRSSDNIYNQSLLASMVAAHGEERATEWARNVVANMARRPQGGDRDQIMAVAAGVCDVAIVNTYYYGRMLDEGAQPDQRKAAQQVALFFPNQDGRGAHVNVSGAGVTRHADHPDNAVRLLEFLVSDEAQAWYAEVNFEYPVVPDAEVSEAVRAWGYPFKQDRLPLTRLGELNATAVRIFDRVGWR